MIDHFRMLRIDDWIKFYMPIPLTGAVLAGIELHKILLILVIYFCLISYAFVVNNYFDVEIDSLHRLKMERNKNPLAKGRIDRRSVQGLMLLLIIFPLLVSLYLSKLGCSLVLLNILIFTAYSASHIRLKERIGWDIISHGLMFGAVPFLAGFALCLGNWYGEVVSVALLFFVVACEALIAHQVSEYAEDVRSTTTTVTRIGQRRGMTLLGLSAMLSLMTLSVVAHQHGLPSWMVAALACYLLVYPIYSCRGAFFDIGYSASAE